MGKMFTPKFTACCLTGKIMDRSAPKIKIIGAGHPTQIWWADKQTFQTGILQPLSEHERRMLDKESFTTQNCGSIRGILKLNDLLKVITTSLAEHFRIVIQDPTLIQALFGADEKPQRQSYKRLALDTAPAV